MAVINISIVESPIQRVAGIPEYIILDSSIPATIFYTIDGSDPDISSDIAIDKIYLPTNVGSVVVKAFATNGVDETSIIYWGFGPDWTNNRLPHAKVVDVCNVPNCTFTGTIANPEYEYDQPAGITVDALDVNGIPDRFDGSGTNTYANETGLPYTRENYNTIYSTTNSNGEPGPGTLPAKVTIIVPDPINKSSDANSKLFNPKSMVIYQDGREPNENGLPILNRQFFSLFDKEKVRDGLQYRLSVLDGSIPTGSMLIPQYNPKDNTYIFYYRDSVTMQWIISKEPVLHSPNNGSITQMVIPTKQKDGARRVYRWIPFKRQILR